MKKTVILFIVGFVLLLAGYAMPAQVLPAALAQDAPTATPAPEPAPTGEAAAPVAEMTDEELAAQIAQMALINPPPQLSEREFGISITPCEVGAPFGSAEVEGETYYCGVFTVPMNWEDPAAGALDLHFVVVKASGEKPSPDPLVYLAGGPGQSAVVSAITAYAKVRPAHDIVRLAQRGTGFGQRLGLEECLVLAFQADDAEEKIGPILAAINSPEEGSADSSASSDAIEPKLNQICWEVFSDQGLDLNQFTTAASARDVVELIKALGYDSFNLHGISFGSRLAMTIMADLPAMEDAPELRSVVLDSPFPPSNYLLSSLPRNGHDQVLQLFEECEQDEPCRQAYPDLKHRLRHLLDSLEAEPLVVDGQTITATDVVKTLSNLSGTRSGFMPQMIAELEMGVPDTYLALMNREIGTDDPEGATGFDTSDPVQAFIANAIPVIAQTGDEGAAFELIGAVGEALSQEDPLTAMAEYIKTNYEGDVQAQLLELLAPLTVEDIANSPLVTQLQEAKAAAEAAANGEGASKDPEKEAADQLAQQRLLAVINVAHFLNKNIHCNEDIQFERYEDGVNTYNDLAFPELASLDYLRQQAASCDNWPVDAAPIEVKNPLSSTVPALILQGAYDTKTPVFLGRRLSRELENGVLALVPQQGHEIWTNATSCAGQIASAFVLDPEQEPDLSCLDARRPQWSLPDKTGMETNEAASTNENAEAASGGDTIEATFVCPDGTSIPTVFDNDADTVTISLPDETLTLPRVESGSGAKYSDGSTTFWNKGDEALLEVNGETMYENCTAQN